jgi:hypothetical protein
MSIICLGGSNLILRCCKYNLIYALIVWAGFGSIKNMESGSLVLYCLIFHIFETVCPSFFLFQH